MAQLIACITQGTCVVKPINYDKVKEITQEKEEHPAVFTNKLTEAFRKYASTDLEFAKG